nr:Chain A, antimicrobial peptide [unidentified]2MXG_A Chain A, antimicrobial peptide [unidentified]2MXH_A Chain A, antimicrobial peptide [unidentified]2N65_A Chain A, antimicrobial peptide VG16KRKP [synthetic construct]2N65_B Chain B, antimicrobial peptide VG16KRKP [synthetic construct]2N9M_A Chain A, antimicrobial peptide [synthetic construct]2N9N_A Chain A, antimicrobial peptide [synthetic construct]5WYE_A Chain A, Au-VG16KRKP [Dengue virus]6KBO_A Chain A, VG16KRKP [Dengue virus]6KBV_A 
VARGWKRKCPLFGKGG